MERHPIVGEDRVGLGRLGASRRGPARRPAPGSARSSQAVELVERARPGHRRRRRCWRRRWMRPPRHGSRSSPAAPATPNCSSGSPRSCASLFDERAWQALATARRKSIQLRAKSVRYRLARSARGGQDARGRFCRRVRQIRREGAQIAQAGHCRGHELVVDRALLRAYQSRRRAAPRRAAQRPAGDRKPRFRDHRGDGVRRGLGRHRQGRDRGRQAARGERRGRPAHRLQHRPQVL